MRRYVTYVRVSTKEQGKSGLGLAAQQRDIELFLQNYSDVPWEVIGAFQDVGSGADNGRPELQKALALVRKTGAELLVAKVDRLSRRVSHLSALMDDPKVKLRVASMPHADKFQLHIYSALAEQERHFISTRTKAALQAAKARGIKLGGRRGNQATLDARKRHQGEGRCCGFKGGGHSHSSARSGPHFATDRRPAERHGSRRELVADEGFAGAGAAGLEAAAARGRPLRALACGARSIKDQVLARKSAVLS